MFPTNGFPSPPSSRGPITRKEPRVAMDHARVAKDVLTYVGGADNINAAAHCATRLRLVLNEKDKVDLKALDKDPDL